LENNNNGVGAGTTPQSIKSLLHGAGGESSSLIVNILDEFNARYMIHKYVRNIALKRQAKHRNATFPATYHP
jgi:hypothetical protein